jgi:4-alpha-glucanotransferase
LDLEPNAQGWTEIRTRLAEFAGVDMNADVEEVIVGAHAALASAPSLLVSGTLDDAIAVGERPNMPGTMTEWPNWCLALPRPLEEIETHPLADRVAAALQRGRPG